MIMLYLCRMQAEGVKNISNQTKQALEDVQKAVDAAKKALRTAEENLNNSNSSISEVPWTGSNV